MKRRYDGIRFAPLAVETEFSILSGSVPIRMTETVAVEPFEDGNAGNEFEVTFE